METSAAAASRRGDAAPGVAAATKAAAVPMPRACIARADAPAAQVSTPARWARTTSPATLQTLRSEEHTSELQSQSNLVCRLLLEKKKHDTHHPKHIAHASWDHAHQHDRPHDRAEP